MDESDSCTSSSQSQTTGETSIKVSYNGGGNTENNIEKRQEGEEKILVGADRIQSIAGEATVDLDEYILK